MQIQRGYSIRIFFPDSTPDGLWIVDKPNWTGVAVSCPRALLKEKKNRPEFMRPGVYLLVDSSNEVVQKLYIGEGDPAILRLITHLAEKDFWTKAILFTSKDESLHKAHIQYLESSLTQIAAKNKIVDLQNANIPQLPSLGEAERHEMDAFLDEIILIAPILGIDAFEPTPSDNCSGDLQIQSKTVKATGRDTSQGLLVLKGSESVLKETPSTPAGPAELRKHLIAQGVLALKGDRYVFEQNYLFKSPTYAAEVILGRSENGRQVWRNQEGKTLNELQAADPVSNVILP